MVKTKHVQSTVDDVNKIVKLMAGGESNKIATHSGQSRALTTVFMAALSTPSEELGPVLDW